MRDRIVSIVLAVFASVSAIGCATLDPPYETSALVFEDGWLGTWEVAASSKTDNAEKPVSERFVVEERVLHVKGDRICGDGTIMTPLQSNVQDGKTKQYVIRFELHQEHVRGLEFNAFLLGVGDSRLVSLQLSKVKFEEHWQTVRELAPLVLPVQFTFKVERRGDQMFAWTPAEHVVWIPWVHPLVAPADGSVPRPADVGGTVFGGPLCQASSVDQQLEHYSGLIDQPQAWEPALEGKPIATRQAGGLHQTPPK